jgi:hypothetical protein
MNNTAAVGATPNYVPVYQTTNGFGYYPGTTQPYFNLADSRDQVLPYDLTGSGHADGLICYRPGTGVVYEIKHDMQNGFYTWFDQSAGIWNNGSPTTLKYDFSSNADRIIPYDYFGNGMTNNIVCYRPGGGACYMMDGFTTNGYGNIDYHASNGIGSGTTFFDLSNGNDKVFAYDFDGTGKIDHLVCYRPGGKRYGYLIMPWARYIKNKIEGSAPYGSGNQTQDDRLRAIARSRSFFSRLYQKKPLWLSIFLHTIPYRRHMKILSSDINTI